jgi:hypothetical protein
MAYLPRGIAPDLLVSQIKNTMPYLFEEGAERLAVSGYRPVAYVREFEADPTRKLSHFEYFRLCLSAHMMTCGTPVPTDVDIQIRQKLWPAALPLEEALQMASLVIESRCWEFGLVSNRSAPGAPGTPWEKELLTGHDGEWFTVAVGAYCALKQYRDPQAEQKRSELLAEIADETHRHSEIFGSLWKVNDGVGCLKACVSIAHNFGDMDRVMDMWDLAVDDPLRLEFYKIGIKPFGNDGKLRYLGRLWVAGELYKAPIDGSSMASENHRHFALRKPRCLRRSPELLIHNGPFLDSWGRDAARLLAAPDGNPSDDALEVIEALRHGWERLPKTFGYARALHGILKVYSRLKIEPISQIPGFRNILELAQDRFEKRWNEAALKHMDEIPSRA